MRINLHCHSSASDGKLVPRELMDRFNEYRLEFVSLTDHDTIEGVLDAKERANNLGIIFIPGIEFSVSLSLQPLPFLTTFSSFHLLGLGFDVSKMDHQLKAYYEEKNKVIFSLLETLSSNGYPISIDQLPKREFWMKGDIATWLVQHHYANSVTDAFISIINKFPQLKTFNYTPKQVIELIHKASGKAIMAHPYDILEGSTKRRLTTSEVDTIVAYLVSQGVDGIEANYQPFDNLMQRHLNDLAIRYGLITSYGTDYHGKKSDEAFYMEADFPPWLQSKRVKVE